MHRWLNETRGPTFELFRHFLGTLFDSDLVTATEHTPMALVGAVGVAMQWMFLYVQPIKAKYAYLSKLTSPGPYRDALRADELWLITLAMAAMGVLTAIKWQALFPSLRDYRALASLPLRPAQIFAAKLLALLTVSVVAVLALNLFPGFGFPALSGGRWSLQPSAGTRALGLFTACAAGSYFFFFGLAAFQGLLLLLLPPHVTLKGCASPLLYLSSAAKVALARHSAFAGRIRGQSAARRISIPTISRIPPPSRNSVPRGLVSSWEPLVPRPTG